MGNNILNKIEEAANFISSKISNTPRFGIILGTGLGGLVDEIEVDEVIDYSEIPHFPLSTVEFHSGKLILGRLGGKHVICMQGRFHYYEGYSMEEVVFPVRVMKSLGVEKLFVSNASGAVNPSYKISDLMIINDHINLLPENPLRGKNYDELGDRFPDMSDPYDEELIEMAVGVARRLEIPVHTGVYVAVTGPNLETPAEYRYMRIIGADAVGMSTVPENIAARHMGLPVFAISVITDLGVAGKIKKVDVPEILAAAAKAEPGMTKIIKHLIAELP